MRKDEYILCAAIHYDDGQLHEHSPKNIKTGYVVCGRRHHNCINLHFTLTGKPTRTREGQGFITSYDRFVNRKEGAEIAYKAGQIKEPSDMLISEDLYLTPSDFEHNQ